MRLVFLTLSIKWEQMETAEIYQVFFSIQGEGPFIGFPQIFIRFAGCNLSCRYCDLSGKERREKVSSDSLAARIYKLAEKSGFIHSVSLTGGEPLCQTEFLVQFLPLLKKKGFKIYLETNGTLSEKLRKVKKHLDFIAMDIKIPSATGLSALWSEHRRFLRECASLKADIFGKITVTEETLTEEVVYGAALLQREMPTASLILQPAIFGKGHPEIKGRKALNLLKVTNKILPRTRLIMPIHRFLRLP